MPSKVENQQSLSARVTLTSGQRKQQGGSVIWDELGVSSPWDGPWGTQRSPTEPRGAGGDKLG